MRTMSLAVTQKSQTHTHTQFEIPKLKKTLEISLVINKNSFYISKTTGKQQQCTYVCCTSKFPHIWMFLSRNTVKLIHWRSHTGKTIHLKYSTIVLWWVFCSIACIFFAKIFVLCGVFSTKYCDFWYGSERDLDNLYFCALFCVYCCNIMMRCCVVLFSTFIFNLMCVRVCVVFRKYIIMQSYIHIYMNKTEK